MTGWRRGNDSSSQNPGDPHKAKQNFSGTKVLIFTELSSLGKHKAHPFRPSGLACPWIQDVDMYVGVGGDLQRPPGLFLCLQVETDLHKEEYLGLQDIVLTATSVSSSVTCEQ